MEVLALKRSAHSRFGPGFVVFPGGTVEQAIDEALAVAWFGSASQIGRACALRELAEETGLVATAGGIVVSQLRRADEPGLAPPDPARLPEIARWIAPEFLPVRFDARFYALAAEDWVEPVPDGVEAEAAWWTSPATLLHGAFDGDTLLMWPTLRMLEALEGCRSVAEVLELRVEQVAPPMSPAPPFARP